MDSLLEIRIGKHSHPNLSQTSSNLVDRFSIHSIPIRNNGRFNTNLISKTLFRVKMHSLISQRHLPEVGLPAECNSLIRTELATLSGANKQGFSIPCEINNSPAPRRIHSQSQGTPMKHFIATISRHSVLVLFCIGALGLLGSCATIFSDSDYSVRIDSNPSEMEFSIIDKKGVQVYKGTTPSIVRLSASAGYFSAARYTINLHKDGEVVGSTSVYGSIDGWYFVNLLAGGLIGMLVVDPVTGAMWKLEETVFVNSD